MKNKKEMMETEVDLGELIDTMMDDPYTAKVPALDVINQYRLIGQRRLWLDFEVGPSIMECERMIWLWNNEDKGKPEEEREPIWIYLFNYGGSFDLEVSLIDLMEMSATPVYTVNLGVCASAAADIFIAGKKRFMTKNARVMIHQGSGGFSGDSQKIFDQVEDYKRQLDKTKQFILSHTNISKKMFTSKEGNDWWIGADDCLKYGVCDQIISNIEELM